MLTNTEYTEDYNKIRETIKAKWEAGKPPPTHTLVLRDSRGCIKVSQGLGPFGGWGQIKVVIPFPPEMHRYIYVPLKGQEYIDALAFDMYRLPEVERVQDGLKIRFSREEFELDPAFVDKVIEFIDKVVSVLSD
jgi:hypothetical protein